MSTKLIVESGSTKTDWIIVSDDGEAYYSTSGINPSANEVLYELELECSELIQKAPTIEDIHYFGAGVIDDRTRKIIKEWLNIYFPDVRQMEIEGDMLGAAKATAGDKEGIICILGTGSNSCIYDGYRIIDNIPALGYSLSNEGGGSRIGGDLLKAYFYRYLPAQVKEEFEDLYKITKSQLVQELYAGENPTAYLASFAQFLNSTQHKDWRKEFLSPIFQEFVDIRIKQYSEYLRYDIHFVGSIAYFYADVIKDVLQSNGLTSKSIIRKPIDGLVNYFKS
ncbi:MAG: hypothetical protein AAGA77_08480 [Bacteroidota bacterium]